jgi:transcriptional regulator with XRE-family HTH domain
MADITELTELGTDGLDPEAVRIGATIRELRGAHGWKVGQLAKAVGRSSSFLSNIEAGRKRAPQPLCVQIAAVLGVRLASIVSPAYPVRPEAQPAPPVQGRRTA